MVLNGINQVNSFQNRFEFQNKERGSTFNLRRISFGARTYNASIGRFDGVDQLADFELISPYSYVLNSPLIYKDPFGDSTVHVNNLNWQKFNPEKDDILLDAAVVKPASAGTKVMEGISSLWGWIDQIFNGNRSYYDGREVDRNGILTNRIKPITGSPQVYQLNPKRQVLYGQVHVLVA